MAQKVAYEKEKKSLLDLAAEKDVALKKLVKTIGNYVHDRYACRQILQETCKETC